MPNPNAMVASVVRVEGDTVELGNQRRVRLDAARTETRGFGPILDGVRRLRQPVYLEIDPGTSAITRVRIPVVARVVALRPSADGFDVELDNSHARHVLRRDGPDFAQHERELLESTRTGRVMIVTEDDAHTIIDVRAFTPGPDGDLPPLPPFPDPRPPRPRLWWLIAIWRWRWWPWWWFCCVSRARAQQIFDAMAATTCAPLTVPPPCIPFMFPDDGCWGRAHEMCRLMLTMGVTPDKVWINKVGPLLKANTRNNPQCFVEWFWHVAPTICVRRFWFLFFWSEPMVVDPSLFTTPVTKAAWKGAQQNPNATLTDTPWTYFYQSGGTDPTFSQTNVVLDTYRLQLQLRSLSSVGPPPYASCP